MDTVNIGIPKPELQPVSDAEANDIIERIRGFEKQREFGDWLKSQLGKKPVFAGKQQFPYAADIFASCGLGDPAPVGVVIDCVVEVQKPFYPTLPRVSEMIDYPIALRGPGEIIGEVEYAATTGMLDRWARPWTAYAGMQTFFAGFFGAGNGVAWDRHKKVRDRLLARRRLRTTTVAWFRPELLRPQAHAGGNDHSRPVGAREHLYAIGLGRLLFTDSGWHPNYDDFKRVRHTWDSNGRPWPAIKLARDHPGAERLCAATLLAIQGTGISFRPFSREEMKMVTPWEDAMLRNIDDRARDPGNLMLFGIQTKPGPTDPILILPHFFARRYASPLCEYKKVEGGGSFYEPMLMAVTLMDAVAQHYRDTQYQDIAGGRRILGIYQTDPPSAQDVDISGDVSPSSASPFAASEQKDSRAICLDGVSRFEGDPVAEACAREAAAALGLPKVSSLGDFRRAGPLGTCAIVALPRARDAAKK